MYRLVKSETLQRKIRKDDWGELGIPTVTLLEQVIRESKTDQALELLDYLFNQELKFMHDLYNDWVWALLTYLADNFGEEEVPKVLRYMRKALGPVDGKSFQSDVTSSMTVEELVQQQAEAQRAHFQGLGETTITEEEDRYVIANNPCGSGGRMRRTGRANPPYNFGVTKKPYPWSWGKIGVPYYCTHCALWWGIMAIEKRGYPVRVHEFPDNPEGPCRLIFYKKPELIPEKYFAELGMKKEESRFAKKEM